MLGHHLSKAATDAEQRRRALSIVEPGEPHEPHLRLRVARAEAHIALRDPPAARALPTVVPTGNAEPDERDNAKQLSRGRPG